MPSYNRVILMGNLTRDPELKYLQSGTPLVKLGLAVNHKFKDKQTNELREDVLYVDVDFFGPRAETINQYFSKGRPIHVEGRLKLDSWEDENGNKRSKHSVIGDNFTFVQSNPDQQNGGQWNTRQQQQPQDTGQNAGATVDGANIPF